MKTCFLFPGQGAQYPGMGHDLYNSGTRVHELFELASDVFSKDFRRILFEGDERSLQPTDVAQPAITLVNLASSMVLADHGVVPQFCAGFSLGEYAALWQAAVLDTESLFGLVKLRGEVMEAASRNLDGPDGPPGMTAVVGLDIDEIRALIADIDDVHIANHNSPIQSVLSGSHSALKVAEAEMDKADAMQVVRLKVSGPFHCPLMEDARAAFAEGLDAFNFNQPNIPVISNVTGAALRDGREARNCCLEQIVSMVRWVDVETTILSHTPERILETGPGTVLRGLWKSFNKKIKCQPAGTVESIGKLVS